MGKLTHLMIHCAATLSGQNIKPSDIERMHMGLNKKSDGTMFYKGKKYYRIEDLPKETIGGVPASKSNGRGWSRVGYSKFFTLDGEEHTLRDYNEDNWIDSNEYTNGATGMNMVTRHFCYAGGLTKNKIKGEHRAFITMTEEQENSLLEAIRTEIENHPNILVCGHNQYANKGCPSVNTVLWLEAHGIPPKNIDRTKMRTSLIPVFGSKLHGDAFRQWVVKNHPGVALAFDLDPKGSHTNDYITKAYYLLRHKYAKDQVVNQDLEVLL